MLDRDTALAALSELAAVLAKSGVEGRVYVVGGAAMLLAYGSTRSTRDIDAVFEPTQPVRTAVAEVAERLGLPDDWLNDAVKGFVPGTDPEAVPVLRLPGLEVAAASARFMLGMKLLAARVERDTDDILALARLLGLRTPPDVLAVVASLYPDRLLTPRTRFLVEELFSDGPRRFPGPSERERTPPP
jgi:hypothetical protein